MMFMQTSIARHAQRATREGGQKTRSRLLDAAAALFQRRGFAEASLSEVAAAAGAFPSQITYYFRSKEALFVEAACRELLHAGQAVEAAAAGADHVGAYREALVRAVASSPALTMMAEAMSLAARRQDLAPQIAETFARLHAEGARAYAAHRTRRCWASASDPLAESQRFWALALGVGLRVAATGGDGDACAAEMLRLLRMDPITEDTAP
jgi:AcrR family transcriptional regulator